MKISGKIAKLNPFFVGFVVFVFVALFDFAGLFEDLERKSYDSRVNFALPYRSACDDIVFIMVDQESINRAAEDFGWVSWPWPRSAYGKIYEYLDASGAASCTLDILFSEVSSFGQADDEAFAESLRSGRNTLSLMAEYWDDVTDASRLLRPVEVIRNSVDYLGNSTSIKDSDDVIRRTRVVDNVDGTELISMGFAPVLAEAGDSRDDRLKGLPFLEDGTLKLNFKGSIDYYIHYSAYEVLKSISALENPSALSSDDPFLPGGDRFVGPECFAGAHVFVIYYAPGLFDICATPVSKVYPGAGVSITTLDNFLTDSFIRTVPAWLDHLILLAVCLLGACISYCSLRQKTFFRSVVCSAICFAGGLGVVWAANLLLFVLRYDALFVPLVAGFVFAYLFNVTKDYIVEGKQKRFIKNAFRQYLSPEVINQLIANPEQLALGGTRRNITIFFSDVQDFTSLGEKLSPEDLTEVLNLYLSELSSIIMENGGTIDKYEGDAIVAFWNAPLDVERHSAVALETAVKCQEKLAELAPVFEQKAGRPMWTRIGINTGSAVVGNMGSQHRFDYTMFGDNVNLASRLEGLNKQFGTYILCSESTMTQALECGCTLYFRELGNVIVAGKTEAVRVFEPMLPETAAARQDTLRAFDAGLQLFYKGMTEDAEKVFAAIKDDAPAAKYARKCRSLIQSGASENGRQGIWVADSK